jgi:anti-anti-sigma regulatory factor
MAAERPIRSQILAATAENCTLVAVSGAATFRLAPAFKQATHAARLAGSALIVVDMAACDSMDSTFMGAIASFGFAFQKSEGPQFVLINLSANADALLKGLGVDRILKIYPAGALPAGLGNLAPLVQNLRPVEAAVPGAHELAALMYDAHETLTRVDPENLQRFKDVLAFLREDLKRL